LARDGAGGSASRGAGDSGDSVRGRETRTGRVRRVRFAGAEYCRLVGSLCEKDMPPSGRLPISSGIRFFETLIIRSLYTNAACTYVHESDYRCTGMRSKSVRRTNEEIDSNPASLRMRSYSFAVRLTIIRRQSLRSFGFGDRVVDCEGLVFMILSPKYSSVCECICKTTLNYLRQENQSHGRGGS
jgi:hypothetical protein